MKWIRFIVIALVSALTAGLFALHSQTVELDPAISSTIVPTGDLFLLSETGELTKLSQQGRLLWTVRLAEENEDGDLLRYSHMISDRSGSVYLVAQKYERRVDAAGQVQEIILSEEVQTWSGDGVQQDTLLKVDKTALSQYSTRPYIQKLQMSGDILLALCCDQGQFDVIELQPYGAAQPRILLSQYLGEKFAELEDCAALSDGTLVYSTKGGGLFRVAPDGTQRDLQALIGAGSMAGAVSSDETDSVYFADRSNGAFYRLDPAGNTVTRLYGAQSVIHEAAGTAFEQVRNVRALGDGAFYAVSVDGENPFCVRFGAGEYQISSAYRGWDRMELARTAAVFAGTALLLWLLSWALTRLGRRSLLISRILLYFLPVLVLVLAVLAGGLFRMYTARSQQARRDSLASAAKSAASLFDEKNFTLTSLRRRDQSWRDNSLGVKMAELAEHAADISGLEDVGIVLYVLENGSCFGVSAANERDAFLSADYLAPLSMELPAGTVEAILGFAAEGGSVDFHRGGAAHTSYFQSICGANGIAVGLVEARAPRQDDTASPVVYFCAAVTSAAVLILLWLLLVLKYAFRPLKDLRRCIGEISAGNWNVKAKAASQDELADISLNFNQMTEKLNQYISSMVLLNNEYIKFTPRELFQLMGKTKVTDLHLRDKSVRDISLLYVNFRTEGAALDSEEYFALMNESFDRIFDVVDKNQGIIERFDGSGMLALFPWQVRDALNTAISLKEIITRESGSVELKMLISADEMLVGVAGNEKRQNITAISKTIMDIYALTGLMDEIGTRYIITKRAVEHISDDFYFNCREIGSGDTGRESLYEFLDGMDTYEKKLHLVTKEEFEQGVHDYQNGRYFQARKHFVNVLQVNEKDTVAMNYLMLCDRHVHGEET